MAGRPPTPSASDVVKCQGGRSQAKEAPQRPESKPNPRAGARAAVGGASGLGARPPAPLLCRPGPREQALPGPEFDIIKFNKFYF